MGYLGEHKVCKNENRIRCGDVSLGLTECEQFRGCCWNGKECWLSENQKKNIIGDLWKYCNGAGGRTCNKATAIFDVKDRTECQLSAANRKHDYYQYHEDNKKCATAPSCHGAEQTNHWAGEGRNWWVYGKNCPIDRSPKVPKLTRSQSGIHESCQIRRGKSYDKLDPAYKDGTNSAACADLCTNTRGCFGSTHIMNRCWLAAEGAKLETKTGYTSWECPAQLESQVGATTNLGTGMGAVAFIALAGIFGYGAGYYLNKKHTLQSYVELM